jgi:hypothetical protein
MDLAALIQQAAILNNTQTQQASNAAGLYAGAGREASGIAQNVTQQGILSSQAELVKLQGELNTQNAKVKVANAFGTNANAVSDVITGMAEGMRNDAVKLVKAQDNVSRIEAGSDLLGNPMGWLEDLLTGDEARAGRDALASSFDTKSKLVQSLNAATQTSVQTQNAITETLSASSIKQLAEVKRLSSESEAAKARIEAAKYGVASVEALQQVGAANFSRSMSMYNAVKQDEQWQLARSDRLEARKDKDEAIKDIEEMTGRINTYRQVYNLPSVSTAYIKRNWGAGQVGDQLREQELGGWKIVDNKGSTEGSLGATPAEAYGSYRANQLTLPPAFKPSLSILSLAEQAFQAEVATVGRKDPTTGLAIPTEHGLTPATQKDPSVMKSAFNAIVEETSTKAASMIIHDSGNVLQALPIESVLQSPTPGAIALKESTYGKLVLQAMVATGVSNPNPEILMATSLNLVASGELSMQEAIDGGVSFYQESNGLLHATGGFGTMNVKAYDSYNVPVDSFIKASSVPAKQVLGFDLFGTIGPQEYISGDKSALKKSKVKSFNLVKRTDFTTAMTIMNSNIRSQELLKGLANQQ